jgi:hypothetical protein
MTSVAHHRTRAIRFRNIKIIHGFVLLWLVICVCVATFNRELLPAKYFFDASGITSRFGYVTSFVRGESFDNTALMYEMLLLSSSPRLNAPVSSLIFSIFVFRSLVLPERMDRQLFHDLLIFSFTCVVGAVYLAQYSKEAIVMSVIFVFFWLSRGWKQQVIWMVLVCIYAAYFRSYWFLVLLCYIYYAIVLRFARNLISFFLSVAIAFLILALLFKGVLGVDLAYYRYLVNEGRMYDLNANTMILPLLPTGGIGLEWLNAVIQFLLMFFPFPLLNGNPVYLIFFVTVASIGLRLFGIVRSSISTRNTNVSGSESRCLALFVSFVTIQSIFEPDYGSYIKHLTPILPLVLYVLSSAHRRQINRA